MPSLFYSLILLDFCSSSPNHGRPFHFKNPPSIKIMIPHDALFHFLFHLITLTLSLMMNVLLIHADFQGFLYYLGWASGSVPLNPSQAHILSGPSFYIQAQPECQDIRSKPSPKRAGLGPAWSMSTLTHKGDLKSME